MREFSTVKYFPVLRRAQKTKKNRNVALHVEETRARSNSIESLEISIHNNLNGLEAAWRELEKNSNISIYQRFDWINTCINTIEHELNSQALIVTARKNGKLVFILPLAVQSGLVRELRWIGGSHSNFNLALFEEKFGKSLGDEDIKFIFDQIVGMLPGIGYMKLCCQPVQWGGRDNPLLALAHQRSTNNAFGMDLSCGFARLLAKGNGKRKRKKFRSQMRAVKSFGGAELIEAKNPRQVLKLLECFHRQKSVRLRNQGLRNVFGGKEAHLFLQRMALDSLTMDEPILKLYALQVAGQFRAICGGGVLGKHFSAYFISFADDELAHISPGDMLLHMLVEKLADGGFQSMDLGGGEERYKRSWCPQTIEMFDVILPISIFSYGHVWAFRLSFVIKRLVRENPRMWKILKRSRIGMTRFLDIFKIQ